MITWLLYVISTYTSIQQGLATTFSRHDAHNPDPTLACYNRLLDDHRDLVIASRTLPCRSLVMVCSLRTKRCTLARVGDRGPYGKRRSGKYRAIVDLAPATARYIQHNGYEPVSVMEVSSDFVSKPWYAFIHRLWSLLSH